MEVESDQEALHVGPGQAAIISGRSRLRLRWSEDCEQIILRVPHAMLRQVSVNAGIGQRAGAAGPVRILDEGATSHWIGLLQNFLDTLVPAYPVPANRSHPAWIGHVEHGLALFTLLEMQSRGEEAKASAAAARAPVTGSETRLGAAERYAQARLCAPLALDDLARAARVSPRTFYMDCTRHFGVGPMAWLRGVRLDAARRKLSSDPNCNVTQVASECGFGHLGRFASYYRQRFGELPSETVQHGRELGQLV
jgi:AraC-like DNA-binding protein